MVAQEPSIWRRSQVPNATTMHQLGWSQRLPARLKRPSRPEPRPQPESHNFPTISYQNCWAESVRLDLTEPRKSSSTAKHCMLLRLLGAERRSKKIPLPAPTLKSLSSKCCRNSWNSSTVKRVSREICRRGLFGPQKSVERAARFEIETHGRFRTIDAVDKRTGAFRRA